MKDVFPIALRYVRRSRGISQGALGEMIGGRTQASISSIEKGVNASSEKTRRALAEALGWPFEAMYELGRLLDEGAVPSEAEARALALYSPEAPPPILGPDQEDLRGFRVRTMDGPGQKLLWVSRETIEGRDHTKLQAWEAGGRFNSLVLVDTGRRKRDPGAIYLLKPISGGLPVMREFVEADGSVVLKGMWGALEPAGSTTAKRVIGQVLWCQIKMD